MNNLNKEDKIKILLKKMKIMIALFAIKVSIIMLCCILFYIVFIK